MYRYTRSDFDRVLEFLRGLGESRDCEGFGNYLLSALPTLVPGHVIGVSGRFPIGTASASQAGTSHANPPEFASTKIDALAARYNHESPMFGHVQRGRTGEFMRWSDLQPFSQFRRTGLYNELYRPLGARDCCTHLFSCAPDAFEAVGTTLDKRIPDADRDILMSISPHLQQAFRAVHTTSALLEAVEMRDTPRALARGIVAIDSNGTITMESAVTTRLLDQYFEKRSARSLPDRLARWLRRSVESVRKAADVPEVRCPFVMERGGCRLTVHPLSKPEQNFLVLEEHRCAIDPTAFRGLPVTQRESEILAYVANGKTNPEIGIILGISSRTVSKHVEHILERLGVETRTAAAAVALEAAN